MKNELVPIHVHVLIASNPTSSTDTDTHIIAPGGHSATLRVSNQASFAFEEDAHGDHTHVWWCCTSGRLNTACECSTDISSVTTSDNPALRLARQATKGV